MTSKFIFLLKLRRRKKILTNLAQIKIERFVVYLFFINAATQRIKYKEYREANYRQCFHQNLPITINGTQFDKAIAQTGTTSA